MGEVYKAEDLDLKRTVALKFLSREMLGEEEVKARLIREAQAAASLDHPSVCHVYGIHQENGETFLAMAYIDGPNLAEKIKECPLPLEEALDIAIQIAEGLQEAHEQGVVHRDIKPSNVMLDRRGRVKVMDFGLAAVADRTRLTKSGTTLGTPAYMSPEQAQGQTVDRRTDIWAVGVVLYEMLAGKHRFAGEYEQAILYSIINEDAEPVTALRRGVPPKLDDVLAKALAKGAGQRYQHADELIVDLRTLADDLKSGRSTVVSAARSAVANEGPAAAAPRQTVGNEIRSSNRLPWVLFTIATVALSVFAYLHFTEAAPERRVQRFVLDPKLVGGAGLTQAATEVWQAAQDAALSPDGRHIAYRSDETPPRLWLWSLADSSPRPLPGTENARAPFWGPDSEKLGFIDAEELAIKRTTLTAPNPALVCSMRDGSTQQAFGTSGRNGAAAWSPDGRTIFIAWRGQLLLVPASGGDAEPLQIRRPPNTRPTASVVSYLPTPPNRPALLLSYALSISNTASGSFLLDLSSLELRRLSDDPSVRYSPSGHLLFTDDQGGLWAQPFSLETLEPTGDRFGVAAALSASGISSSGALLAVEDRGVLQSLRQSKTELVLRDRAGNRLDTIGPALVGAYNPVVSPDGRSVLVAAKRSTTDDQEIWLLHFGRNTIQRITCWPGGNDGPNWHPDGKQIVFRHELGDGASDLFLTSVGELSDPTPVVETPERESEPAWSPDGETLIYMARHIAGTQGFDLYLAKQKADGGFESSPFHVSEFNIAHPQFSPDGEYLAFLDASSGRSGVYVRAVSDATQTWQVSEDEGMGPRWSRDGRELFWMTRDPVVMMRAAVDFSRPTTPISGIEPLFDLDIIYSGGTFYYDVTPDGRFVIVERVDESTEGQTDEPLRMRLIENWFEEFRDREQD